jgi:hypothetical protein
VTDVYRYDIDRRFLPVLAAFGLHRTTDGVRLDGEHLIASFGWFHVKTTLANIGGAHVTRGYRWWTAIGARTSYVDDGLTFGTNNRAGVCIHFKDKVPSVLRRKGHSALTVTVADLDGLTRAIEERC